MDNGRRTPSLHLISTSHPARPLSTSPSSYRPSQSPFRYVQFDDRRIDEKDHQETPSLELSAPASSTSHRPQLLSTNGQRTPVSAIAGYPSHILSQPSPLLIRSSSSPVQSYSHLRMLRLMHLIRPWIPVIMYGLTSLGFLVTIAFFKTELFTFLDELSGWLRKEKEYGYALLFLLIFITTFPPMPLYSTLIILSGYTFGPWIGATISYLAALTGALTVFIVSRTLLRRQISDWLDNACSMKRVVCAIEKRPKLLFLIRLAPYPYNVMNCLLAAAPSLTLRTFTVCTAMSLFKVIIHTSLGASIHSFKDYHVSNGSGVNSTTPARPGSNSGTFEQDATGAGDVARIWTIGGVVLCVSILVYLSYVARKAINEELEGQDPCTDEETVAFLSPVGESDLELGLSSSTERMTETPFRSQQPLTSTVSVSSAYA
ncbi:hypothetical protein E1B28_004519 [Marasmius oreades]|uniref:Golgi apparatus membrane protein TVP38 n=1 Tax=Marasmius oreades TaxID=181124 RepID=A0A9P7UYW5_9AGAR|nr:uncharacterized protein E1B28_004519 [Marasmius oreades]KAG7097141.1 hypothetical protein E1B28_004519 [Marasmius oreades]